MLYKYNCCRRLELSTIPGHEGIGHVVAIGEHTSNKELTVGARVGIKWLANVCLR